ncbi:sensor histidine kinase [Litoreibacter arenae]|uniref:histidine kinase n=1 Tax=Litoreibacter arenae DSM 19593 TaxID=1123360 RepID=S9RFF4_9RHOB|nr:HAMP domain-containing sensor histidine kinase [Litoreibacter arenae]EPX76840.1 Sensor histidine kinase in cluster with mercury reductase [Litoreibacter arenae DSM 19593]
MLTIIFVMIAEVLIFVPSVARFRQDYLLARLEKSQIASLSVLASQNQNISSTLAQELLDNAGVYNVVLRRDAASQLVLSSPVPGPITTMVDLRDPSPWYLIAGALMQLFDPPEGVIRVIGSPTQAAGTLIEVAMPQAPLRSAMIDYGLRVLALSAFISIISAALLFLAVRRFMVKPIKRVVTSMEAYAKAPEDARRVIVPKSSITELRAAEDTLAELQTRLTGSLKQKEHLAQLGGAVAKISHDLRNILTTATLLADRMERSDDPAVQRSAPKLVNSLSRAVNLCEGTLAFGRVDEAPPKLAMTQVQEIVDDVLQSEQLSAPDGIRFECDVPPHMMVRCDSEQLHRILGNLVRNARQALETTGEAGVIKVSGTEDANGWHLTVSDTGPGLPPKARENLFTAFEGGVRKGGTGLGLAIASELARGHGGALTLVRSDEQGTEFQLFLPKENALFEDAAE